MILQYVICSLLLAKMARNRFAGYARSEPGRCDCVSSVRERSPRRELPAVAAHIDFSSSMGVFTLGYSIMAVRMITLTTSVWLSLIRTFSTPSDSVRTPGVRDFITKETDFEDAADDHKQEKGRPRHSYAPPRQHSLNAGRLRFGRHLKKQRQRSSF